MLSSTDVMTKLDHPSELALILLPPGLLPLLPRHGPGCHGRGYCCGRGYGQGHGHGRGHGRGHGHGHGHGRGHCCGRGRRNVRGRNSCNIFVREPYLIQNIIH